MSGFARRAEALKAVENVRARVIDNPVAVKLAISSRAHLEVIRGGECW